MSAQPEGEEARAPTAANRAAVPLDDLFAQLVTHVAVGGDAQRASMLLELGGHRALRGQVVVHAQDDEVEIEIVAPPGVEASALESRVAQRLSRKGVRVTRFDVR
jgi:hypothetical protein